MVVYTKIDRFPMNSGVFVCCVAGKPRSMSHQDNQLNRLESLRQRFGFWVDAFRVRQILTWLLARSPVRVRSGNAKIRIRCWSDLLAYAEIFRVGIYDPVFDGHAVNTYCDLGCQSGFALLRLAQRSGNPKKAVLIDGNPRAIERCQGNVRAAALQGVHVVHGAVGCNSHAAEQTVRFTLRPNELECALETAKKVDIATVSVDVPVVDIEKLWLERVGDVPCDLLKIDVEGAEMGVLRHDVDFLSRVQRCVLEWHDPPATRSSVIDLLVERGFVEVTPLCEGEKSGVLYCRRPAQEGLA